MSDISTVLAEATGPLAGVVVADFSRVLAGPYATMMLADLGATIIKVESPAGDETRSWRPPVYGDDSTYYLSVNRNKQSIVLDLKDDDDLAVAQALAARADVMIENMKPGNMERFGLDYDAVTAANPNVIYVSITGFGAEGGKELPGYDLLVQGISGMMSLQGDAGGPTYRAGVAVFDVITGLHAATAIVSALFHRATTGEGQRVELNLLSSALSGLANQTGGFALTGKSPQRMGNEHPSIFPYAPFPTADGEIILAIGNDRQFATLCDELGTSEWLDDDRFSTNVARSAHRDELRPMLIDALKAHTAREWFDILRGRKLPCAPLLDVAGGVEFAEEIGLDPIVTVGSGESEIRTIRNPIRFSATPATYRSAPPKLGEHSDAVRQWLRGN